MAKQVLSMEQRKRIREAVLDLTHHTRKSIEDELAVMRREIESLERVAETLKRRKGWISPVLIG